MNKNIPTVVAAGVLVIILVFYMMTFQVRFTETAVVTTFGAPSTPLTEPGVYFKWPWPIQRVVRYDNRLRVLDGVEEELRTRDEQNLVVLAFAEWRIEDPMKFRETVDTVRNGERQIRRLLDTFKKTAVGRYELGQFFSKNPADLCYDALEAEIKDALAKETRDQFGVVVSSVGIKRISLPAGETTNQVLSRMREEQNKLAAEYRARGEAEASRIKTDAESARQRILAFAGRIAQEIEAEGQQAATKLHEAYKEHPEFALFLQKLKYMKAAFGKRAVYVLGDEEPGVRMLRLPPEVGNHKQE